MFRSGRGIMIRLRLRLRLRFGFRFRFRLSVDSRRVLRLGAGAVGTGSRGLMLGSHQW